MKKKDIDFIVSDIFRTAVPEVLIKNKCNDITEFLNENKIINPLTVGIFPDGQRILIDGYEYYDYICEHPCVEFQVITKEFSDKQSAVCYVLEEFYKSNNLTKIQQKLIIYLLYELQKKEHGGRRDKITGQFVNKDGKALAHGVADLIGQNIGGFTHATVQRARDIIKGLDIAEEIMPGIKDDILLGIVKIPESKIINFCNMYDDEIENTIIEYKQNKRIEERICFSDKFKKRVYKKSGGRCYICGNYLPDNNFIVEHKVPLANGGTNDISNLYCSCELCNSIKGTRDYDTFIAHILKIADYQQQQNKSKIS